MSRENIDHYDFVPLGRPIHNVQLVVVNKDLNICSVGEPGELCVAGAGIGAGYINDPETTAESLSRTPSLGFRVRPFTAQETEHDGYRME